MSLVPVSASRVPVAGVLAGAAGAQFLDDLLVLVVPPAGVLAPLAGLLAIALTAGAARALAAGRAVPARTGLAVGGTSAVLGLLVGGLGLVAVLLAGLTVLAGVAGAVAGRRP